jgi:hypothetical protein
LRKLCGRSPFFRPEITSNDGTVLDVSGVMKTSDLKKKTREMIRWQFRFRDRLLTCGISKSGASGFSVVTVPHHNVRRGTVEIYQDLASALQRHAAIAQQLRAHGWSIASYTT